MQQKTLIRVEAAKKLILGGKRYTDIVSKLSQSENISRRSAKRIVKLAFDDVKTTFLEQSELILMQNYDRLVTCYEKALNANQFNAAVKAVSTINRMMGFYDKNYHLPDEKETVDFEYELIE